MAQKRMLDKKISVSEQVANLTDRAKLIFTWSLPHADDVGVLPYSLKTLKATIVPMLDIDLAEFAKCVEEITGEGLWQLFEYKGEKYYRLIKFAEHQTLKKDRQPMTLLPITFSKDAKTSWLTLEEDVKALGFHLEGDGFQMETEGKGRELKGTEEKGRVVGANAPSTPKEQAKAFFHGVADLAAGNDVLWLQEFLRELANRNSVPKRQIWDEILKFCSYWTERNGVGTKENWQMQKTFEVDRRLRTWFNRVGVKGFSTGSDKKKGKDIIGL